MLVFNAVDQNRVFDYKGGYSEYLEYKEKYLIANETQETVKAETASKAEYNRKKEEQSNKRKFAHKIEVAKREVRSIEARIQEIDEECNGPAATDHKRLAELFEKRNQIEAKLLEHYEFLMEIGEEV